MEVYTSYKQKVEPIIYFDIQYTLAVLSVEMHNVRNLFCTVYMLVRVNLSV